MPTTPPPTDPSPDDRPDTGPAHPAGFELREVIGRGGMGVVYRGRDRTLNREVAVKLLQDKYPARSPTAARFVAEAQITGQLQHPGIPAVYHVGTLPDGRPFLAMKLIKGDTLHDLLKDRGPGGVWLGPFEQMCHAVGYAHSHGVIHRDLKPANVMVGAFGEVQVMDWGLAKILTPSVGASARRELDVYPTTEITEIIAPRDSDGSETQAGSVLGTPAYMSPEQAAGEHDKTDARADVFGLGAILCALLTGKAVYDSPNPESVRTAAVRGDTVAAFARLDACGADPEVVALCKRCLAFHPSDRLADGNAVADSVAAIRTAADERARRAELDNVTSAERRKRRRVWAVAAGALVVALAAGVVGTTVGLIRANEQRQKAEDATTDLRKLNEDIVTAARTALAEGDADRRRAAALRLQAVIDRKEDDSHEGRREQALRLVDQGKLIERSDPVAALAAYQQAVDLFRPLAESRPTDLVARRGLVLAQTWSGRLLHMARRADESAVRLADAADWAGRNADAFPDDREVERHRYIVANEIGKLALLRQDFPAARRQFEQSLEWTEAFVRRHPDYAEVQHDLSLCHEYLGAVAQETGDGAGAVRQSARAVELREAVAARAGTDVRPQQQLLVAYRTYADALAATGDDAGATAVCRKGLALNTRLTPPDRATPGELNDLGTWLHRLGQSAGPGVGRVHFEEMARLLELSVLLKPDQFLANRNLALAYNALGRDRWRVGEPAAALPDLARSRGITERLVRAHPDDLLLRDDLGLVRLLTGYALLALNRPGDARAEFTAALREFEIVAGKSPASVAAAARRAEAQRHLGRVALAEDDFPAAADWFGKAVATLDPFDRAGKLADFPVHRTSLAETRRQLAEAEAMARVMTDLPFALKQPPEQVPGLLVNRGFALAHRGDHAAAAETAAALVGLKPNDPALLYDAACILAQSKGGGEPQLAAAVVYLRKAVAAGYTDRRHIARDTDLDPLRGRADFLAVLRTLAPEAAPSPRAGR